MKDLTELGPSIYHHHYHQAIVGNNDASGRYNAKWLDRKKTIQPKKSLNQEIGHVNTGDFRRGQGGLFCAMSRPYHATNAPDLYIESEQRKTLIDLGYDNRWELGQSNNRFKK